jgi:hypothetical protein
LCWKIKFKFLADIPNVHMFGAIENLTSYKQSLELFAARWNICRSILVFCLTINLYLLFTIRQGVYVEI